MRLSHSPQMFGKVACRVHHDGGYRKLSERAQHLWLTLLTIQEAQFGPPGIFRASDSTVLDNLSHFTREDLDEYRAELQAAGMLRHDQEERIWWRVHSVRAEYNTPDNRHVAVSWAKKLGAFDRCAILDDYLGAILGESRKWVAAAREAFIDALRSVGIDTDTLTGEPPPEPQREFALEAPAPKPGNGAKAKVLPFRAQEALSIIEDAAGGRFVASNPGRQAVEIERVIKDHPDRADFEEVGRYLAAGGEKYADVLDSRWVTRRNFDAALGRARAQSGGNGTGNSDGYKDDE